MSTRGLLAAIRGTLQFSSHHSAGWRHSSLKDLRSRAVVRNLNVAAWRRTAGCTRLQIRRSAAPELHSPALIAPSLFLIGAFCCLFISLHLRQYESSNPEEPFWTLFTPHRHIVNDLEGLFLTLRKTLKTAVFIPSAGFRAAHLWCWLRL